MFGTGQRKICDRFPFLKFDLCLECHKGTYGCHGKNGAALALKYKKLGQALFINLYSLEEWMRLFGRNYL